MIVFTGNGLCVENIVMLVSSESDHVVLTELNYPSLVAFELVSTVPGRSLRRVETSAHGMIQHCISAFAFSSPMEALDGSTVSCHVDGPCSGFTAVQCPGNILKADHFWFRMLQHILFR